MIKRTVNSTEKNWRGGSNNEKALFLCCAWTDDALLVSSITVAGGGAFMCVQSTALQSSAAFHILCPLLFEFTYVEDEMQAWGMCWWHVHIGLLEVRLETFSYVSIRWVKPIAIWDVLDMIITANDTLHAKLIKPTFLLHRFTVLQILCGWYYIWIRRVYV
jgi:hypothetical protein